MTVIYVDTLFLLNAMVDYLLLLASARLAGEPLARLRFLLGAVLGGLYAVAIFLPGLSFLARPPCRLAAAVLMVLAALLSAALLALGGWALVLAALLVFARYHVVSGKQFGGITGDLAGWFLQKAELWMLAALCACQWGGLL